MVTGKEERGKERGEDGGGIEYAWKSQKEVLEKQARDESKHGHLAACVSRCGALYRNGLGTVMFTVLYLQYTF